uniref:Putative ovule protein n=1 Tax=Solanum chacoense TaxID=4108 RepID=A0A0V0HVW2_SOLCH
MIDSVKGLPPAAEKGCRLTALVDSGGLAEVDLSEKEPNFTRRRRLNERRLKSSPVLQENFNAFAADYRHCKKKKPENSTVTDTDDQAQLATSSEVKKSKGELGNVLFTWIDIVDRPEKGNGRCGGDLSEFFQ